jgi:hypothetical protein
MNGDKAGQVARRNVCRALDGEQQTVHSKQPKSKLSMAGSWTIVPFSCGQQKSLGHEAGNERLDGEYIAMGDGDWQWGGNNGNRLRRHANTVRK